MSFIIYIGNKKLTIPFNNKYDTINIKMSNNAGGISKDIKDKIK